MLSRLLKNKFQSGLILILFFTALLRLYNLNYPTRYVFDEVYHAFTAKEYLKGSKETWEWWTSPPPGVAFEWTHPPLAKEVMAASMFLLHSTDSWAWRLPGGLLGILSVFIIFLLGKKLFKKETIALIAAFLFSIDGLNFVQSRTGMNDIYFVTFTLLSLYFLLGKRLIISAIFFGLAISSKWAAIYYLGVITFLLLFQFLTKKTDLKHIIKTFFYYLAITPLVYLLTYLPFFLLGHSIDQFMELHRQMWYYHTHLKATHDYASPWWSWPLNLYPVWFYVQYYNNGNISNIFTSGNPVLFWIGSGAVLITFWDFLKNKSFALLVTLLGFFAFWLPWAISPRIMFLYHFSPSVPFLCLALSYQIDTLFEETKSKKLIFLILGLILLSFLAVFPLLTGIPLPKDIMQLFFVITAAKNPFGT